MKTNEELKKATNLNIQEMAPDGGWEHVSVIMVVAISWTHSQKGRKKK